MEVGYIGNKVAINKSLIQPDVLKLLKIKLTKVPESYSGEAEPSIFWTEDSDYLYVPRQFGNTMGKYIKGNYYLNMIHYLEDSRNSQKAKITFTGNLREHQKTPLRNLVSNLNKDKIGGMFIAYCGFGKTVAGTWLAAQFGLKTLILCHKEFLMDQWIETSIKFCGITPGKIQRSTCDTSKPITVAMMASLNAREYEGIYEEFGLILVDETHHIAARTFSKAIQRFNPKFIVGLTATPRRSDGMEEVFQWLIGPILVKVERPKGGGKVIILEWNQSVPGNFTNLYGPAKGSLNVSKLITAISKNSERTKWLMAQVSTAYKADRKIMVLSHRRDHLYEMAEILNSLGLQGTHGFYMGQIRNNKKTPSDIHRIKAKAAIKGKKPTPIQLDPYSWRTMKKSERAETSKKRIILATYGQAKEGLDIPDINALVLTTPEKDVEQAVGRAMRSDNPIILDLVDSHGYCVSIHKSRLKFYDKEGLKVQ